MSEPLPCACPAVGPSTPKGPAPPSLLVQSRARESVTRGERQGLFNGCFERKMPDVRHQKPLPPDQEFLDPAGPSEFLESPLALVSRKAGAPWRRGPPSAPRSLWALGVPRIFLLTLRLCSSLDTGFSPPTAASTIWPRPSEPSRDGGGGRVSVLLGKT